MSCSFAAALLLPLFQLLTVQHSRPKSLLHDCLLLSPCRVPSACF